MDAPTPRQKKFEDGTICEYFTINGITYATWYIPKETK